MCRLGYCSYNPNRLLWMKYKELKLEIIVGSLSTSKQQILNRFILEDIANKYHIYTIAFSGSRNVVLNVYSCTICLYTSWFV